MVVFEELISRLEGLRHDMPRLVDESIKDDNISSTMIDMNRDQMYSGIDSFGDKIMPSYVESYRKKKLKEGKRADRVTLIYSGNMYADMETVYDPSQVTLTSTDEKTEKLTKKYGEGIFGLIDPNKEAIRVMFFELLRSKIITKYFPYLD